MPKQKKFGTFGGVFTPSILTILGVIMYLRLPWIAGQAGLYITIGIILLAHLISITTGLSVSSIATDKKVKAGGTYYMISRSLGLPIGGTLGLALFVGLSFSVSLYLIGFAESFLNYWGFETTKDAIRLTGTILLIVVTVVTFISTSLAIKTQYIIMAAIVFSLISIFFGKHDLAPTVQAVSTAAGAVPFIVLFGIFFPAVTGFEAGVSMSGDLRDPKKSIPIGTISAIVVGFIVYIVLAYFLTSTIDASALVNDFNVLLKISLVPELVIAGIWGATLSSALGSILGAPRILQAMSADKIAHKYFAKGVGPSNEPRNALLLTFIIAEAGILIGELDVIARIVSMFFITTYGFLNLSCAIERWASSDFRPDFRIPNFISILGSAACFIVMIQLDFVAMIGATIILGSLFLYLKRKELILGTGDVWNSVWSSVVRKGLSKLSKGTSGQQNWRPNIVLFSGGASARPHLIEIAKWLTGKLGLVSNFHLIEDQSAEFLFNSSGNTESNFRDEEGVFTKSIVCNNIYEGIKVITRVYGFSGVEPNTILMGWGKDTKDPLQFTKVIRNFNEQNLNSIYVAYDKVRGFGNKKSIDVWWRGAGNNFVLELNLVRYISSDPEWRDTHLRFLLISSSSVNINRSYKNLSQILEQYRINGEIKIINNAIERLSPHEIIKAESAATDLIIFGIPAITPMSAEGYINSINALTLELGTTLLVNASTYFEDINIGLESDTNEIKTKPEREDLPVIKAKKNIPLEREILNLSSKVESIYEQYFTNAIEVIILNRKKLINSFNKKIGKTLETFEKNLSSFKKEERNTMILKSRTNVILSFKRTYEEFSNAVAEQTGNLRDSIADLNSKIGLTINQLPKKLIQHYDKEDLAVCETDKFSDKLFKHYKKLINLFSKSAVAVKVRFRDYVSFYLKNALANSFAESLNRFEIDSYKLLTDFYNLKDIIISVIDAGYNERDDNEGYLNIVKDEKNNIQNRTREVIISMENNFQISKTEVLKSSRNNFQFMLNDLEKINANIILKRDRKVSKSEMLLIERSQDLPGVWLANSKSILNTLQAGLFIEKYKNSFLNNLELLKSELHKLFDIAYLNNLLEVKSDIQNSLAAGEFRLNKIKTEIESRISLHTLFSDLSEKLRNDLFEFPESIEIISDKFGETVDKIPFQGGETMVISLRKLVEFYIESEFIGEMQQKAHRAEIETAKIVDTAGDIINLTNFNLQNLESDLQSDISPEMQNKSILESALKRLDNEIFKLTEIKKELLKSISSSFKKAFDPLSSYKIIKSATELSSHVREFGGKRVVSTFSTTKSTFANWFRGQLVKIFYKRSEGVLLAKRISSDEKKEINVADFLSLTESLTPREEVLNKIPFYYKKLFSGRASMSSEFWIGREKEIAGCDKAVQRFFAGQNGGLLITGERNYGKSSLSKYTAEKSFKRESIFFLNATAGGSIDVNEFERKSCIALNSSLSIDEALQMHSGRTAIIINDLELWWERSEDGFKIINRLLELITKYGTKIFFIVNINIHSYELIKKIKTIDHFFLSIVKCEPFDAEELKDIILIRHHASGMKFVLENTPEEEISDIKLARLFNDYFNYSLGNIGAVLNGWIRNIRDVEGNVLYIKRQGPNEMSLLESMPDEWLIYLIQIILHRRIEYSRLLKLSEDSVSAFEETIEKLRRSGLIREYEKNVFELNPYIEPFVINYLIKAEIL